MKLIDYLFYRVYMIDKNQEPLFRGIFFVWLLFLGIALPIILSVRDLFYEKEEMGRLVTYPLGISLGCLVIWRYTKKKENDFEGI